MTFNSLIIFFDTKKINNKINNGKHIKLRIFQLVENSNIPADNEPIDWDEKTTKSFNPCAKNLSSFLYEITRRLVPKQIKNSILYLIKLTNHKTVICFIIKMNKCGNE